MIGAIAHWENAQWVIDSPYAQKKIVDFYKLTAKNFNAPHLILVDIDNQNPACGDEEITFESYKNLGAAIEAHKKANFVLLEVKHKIPKEFKPVELKSFVHPPEDVYYVVGSDFGSIDFGQLDPKQKNLFTAFIETNNTIPLWSHTTLAIGLYDRSIKA